MASSTLDPRLNAYRPDLAAKALAGKVEAERFVEPVLFQVSAGVCSVRKAPMHDAEQWTQALHGETVAVFEERDGFGWGQMASDGYVGWFDMEALSAPVLPLMHKVTALRTYVFSEPSIKSAPHFLLSLNATVTEEARDGRFVKIARSGWVVENHLAALDTFQTDCAAVAHRFLGAPYQWGGVESLGLDCSGLVQSALKACGVACPRDSDMQRSLGQPISVTSTLSGLKRGDIICWQGHVGMMLDESQLIHANAFHMETAIEPLAEAVARIEPSSGPILTIRRLAS